MAQFRKSNLSVALFCKNEGVSIPSFYQWPTHVESEQPHTHLCRRQFEISFY